MSDTFDHAGDAFDRMANGEGDEQCQDWSSIYLTRACKHCHKHGLKWKETDQGWRLLDGDEIHTCKEFKDRHKRLK